MHAMCVACLGNLAALKPPLDLSQYTVRLQDPSLTQIRKLPEFVCK